MRMADLVPVVQEGTECFFVSESELAYAETSVAEVTVKTSALICDRYVPLLQVTATNKALAKGLMDRTDCLDPDIRLLTLYVKLGESVIGLHVGDTPLSQFIVRSAERKPTMELRSKFHLLLSQSVLEASGQVVKDLPEISERNLTMCFSVELEARVNLVSGNMLVEGIEFDWILARAPDGQFVSAEDSDCRRLMDLVYSGQLLGYDVKGRRVNYCF